MKFLRTFFFSVGRQILAMLFAILILFLGFTIFNQRTLETFSQVHSSQTSLIESIQVLKNDFSKSNTLFDSYLKTGNLEDLAQFNNTAFGAFDKIKALSEKLDDDDEIYLVKSIETSFRFYFSECCAASFLFNSKGREEKYDFLEKFNYAQSVISYILKYCDELFGSVIEKNISTNEAMRKNEKVLSIFSLIFVFFMLLSYISFMIYVTRKLSVPMNRLVRASRAVAAGDFSRKIPEYKTANSVGLLTHAFNKMTEDIKKMMDSLTEKVKTEEKLLEEKKKNLEYKELLNQARFLALQSQTNPHFLFNTLNSISRTITLGKTEQSLEMIDSLSSLMRYSLSDADVPVSLEDELEVSREYIRIQQLRFGERIRYEEKIDGTLLDDVHLPKFTLQPIIENALIHGLEPKENGGKILVSAKRRSGRAVIRIFDNGCGIDREVLAGIRNETASSKNGRIGVLNTKKRLEYQEKSKDKVFSIVSRKDEWTMVTISLKMES